MSTQDDRPPEDELKPGAGRPLVEGPPESVAEPVQPERLNLLLGLGGLGLVAAGFVTAIVLIAIVVLLVATHR